ncbi:hypothetical protein ACLK17_16095 [Escherichia coli]
MPTQNAETICNPAPARAIGNLFEKLFGRLFGEGEFQQTRALRRRVRSESAIVAAWNRQRYRVRRSVHSSEAILL